MADGAPASDVVAASPRAPISRPAVVTLSGMFVVGCVLGLSDLISDSDEISTGAGVAVANTVHVVIGAVLVVGLIVTWRREHSAVIAFARAPFTGPGWRRLMQATIAAPCALAEVALLTIGRKDTITRLERWRTGQPATPIEASRQPGWGPTLVHVALGAVTAVILTGTSVLIWFSPIRAGVQVFAAFDPDFTRDAWGGPSYVGASLAHWMDGILMFYAASSAIKWLNARRRAQLDAPQHSNTTASRP